MLATLRREEFRPHTIPYQSIPYQMFIATEMITVLSNMLSYFVPFLSFCHPFEPRTAVPMNGHGGWDARRSFRVQPVRCPLLFFTTQIKFPETLQIQMNRFCEISNVGHQKSSVNLTHWKKINKDIKTSGGSIAAIYGLSNPAICAFKTRHYDQWTDVFFSPDQSGSDIICFFFVRVFWPHLIGGDIFRPLAQPRTARSLAAEVLPELEEILGMQRGMVVAQTSIGIDIDNNGKIMKSPDFVYIRTLQIHKTIF